MSGPQGWGGKTVKTHVEDVRRLAQSANSLALEALGWDGKFVKEHLESVSTEIGSVCNELQDLRDRLDVLEGSEDE